MSNGPQAYTANGTITVSRFVKLDSSASNKVLMCGSGDVPFGISQAGSRYAPIPTVTNDPAQAAIAGESVTVRTLGEVTLLVLGSGGATAGKKLKPDSAGAGVACAETTGLKEAYGAIALESGSAGELIRVEVVIGTITTP